MRRTPRNSHPVPSSSDNTLSRRTLLALSGAGAIATLGAGTLLTACDLTSPGYHIGRMMAVQSIQDLPGSIPLIANKRTIVRVFPLTDRGHADVTNITGRLSVFRGDTTTSPRPGIAEPLHAPVSSKRAVNPDSADHSVDFEIPFNFLGGSDLTVRCDLSTTGGPPWQVSAQLTLHFVTIGKMETLAPVLIQPTSYAVATPTMADYFAMLGGVIKRLPVPETHYILKPPTPWTTNRAMTSGGDFMWLCTDMGWHFYNIFGSDFATGIIPAPPTLPSPRTDGFWTNQGAGAVLGFTVGGPIGQDEAEGTFGHEFSHHYGLGHAAGCLTPSDVDPSLPMNTDMTGMDVPLRRVIPHGASELMSYCTFPRWPSSTTYRRVLTQVL